MIFERYVEHIRYPCEIVRSCYIRPNLYFIIIHFFNFLSCIIREIRFKNCFENYAKSKCEEQKRTKGV